MPELAVKKKKILACKCVQNLFNKSLFQAQLKANNNAMVNHF